MTSAKLKFWAEIAASDALITFAAIAREVGFGYGPDTVKAFAEVCEEIARSADEALAARVIGEEATETDRALFTLSGGRLAITEAVEVQIEARREVLRGLLTQDLHDMADSLEDPP